jgi:hypothetical protein
VKKSIAAILLVLAVILSACSAKATPAPVPTATSAPVPTATQAPTPQPVLFQTDFASEQETVDAGWYLGDQGVYGWAWSPNMLTGSAAIGPYFTTTAPGFETRDGYEIQVQAQPTGNGDAEYGVLFRADGNYNNYYVFLITTDGRYALWKYVNNDWVATIIPYTASEHIHTGNVANSLDLLVAGTQIGIIINGFPEASVSDVTLPIGGYAGLFVRSSEKTAAKVGFSQLKIIGLSTANDVLYQTDFASQQRASDDGWVFGDAYGGKFTWAQNAYGLSLPSGGYGVYQCPHGTYQDFYASAQAKSTSADYAEYGIVMLAPNQNDFLMFGGTTTGYYFLTQYVNGQWVNDIDYTYSPFILQGQGENKLSILGQGGKYFLFINDSWVATMAVDGFFGGMLGVTAWSGQNGNAQAAFSHFEVDSVDKAVQSNFVASALASHSESAVPDDGSASVSFTNNSNTPVNLFWVNPDNKEIQYGSLDAGATSKQHTFPGQLWRLRDAKGQPVLRYVVAKDKQQTVTITQQMVDAAGQVAALPPTEEPSSGQEQPQPTDAGSDGSDNSGSVDTSVSDPTLEPTVDASVSEPTLEPTEEPMPVAAVWRHVGTYTLNTVDASEAPVPNVNP